MSKQNFEIIFQLKTTYSLSIRKSNLKLLLDLFSKMISYFNTTSESVSVVGVSLTNLILTYKFTTWQLRFEKGETWHSELDIEKNKN